MCNNVIVYVIDSTYSNEIKLIGGLTMLGEETFNVPVDERAVHVMRELTMVVEWSSPLNQGTGGDK